MTSDPIRGQSDDIVTHPGPFVAHWKCVWEVGGGRWDGGGCTLPHTLSSGNVSDDFLEPSAGTRAFRCTGCGRTTV